MGVDRQVLHIRDASYVIGGTRILQGISASIPSHTLTGLIGPNGAGKSTLLRLLSGLRRPSQGSVNLGERKLHQLTDRERSRYITLMPQNPTVGFGFVARDVVAMGRHPFLKRLQGLTPECRDIIDEAMRWTEVERFSGRLISELSGGERQRVFLARALAQQPRVMLLDEPTANLDVRHQLEVFELITRLQRERNLTVVMAVHDLTWALRYCTHLIVLDNGRLEAQGPARSIITESLMRRVFGVRASISQVGEHLRLDVISL